MLVDGDVFVKVIDDQPAYYTAEVRVACHLASTDIRTPRLLRHGILDDGRGWLAYEWRDLRPFTPSPPQIEHAGQLLGSLHAATRSLVDAELRRYPTLHELVATTTARVARFDTALADRIRRLHHTLTSPASTELDNRVCLLHGDMGWRNIHLDAHDNTWLIDFEHAAIGHPVLDFAKLWDRELDDPTARATFLRGYHQHQPTDTVQPNQIDTVRLWAAAGIVPYAPVATTTSNNTPCASSTASKPDPEDACDRPSGHGDTTPRPALTQHHRAQGDAPARGAR